MLKINGKICNATSGSIRVINKNKFDEGKTRGGNEESVVQEVILEEVVKSTLKTRDSS